MVKFNETDCPIENYSNIIYNYLISENLNDSLEKFFTSIDSFDYDDFLRNKSIGKIKLPTSLFQMPSNKTYFGTKGMEDGVISFLKSTIFSRSKRDVIIFNDHPINEFVSNSLFVEKWMKGLGMFIIKGLKIYIIHVIDRPIEELMAGLEAWIPLYMTGKIVPYYLQNTERKKQQYNHLLMVSSNVSLSGNAIANHPESGQFYFSKANNEVERCRLRAEQLLQNATSLMTIYVKGNKKQYEDSLQEIKNSNEVIKNFLTVPPIYTISDQLLGAILKRNNVSIDVENAIKTFVEKESRDIKKSLKNGVIYDSVSILNKMDFVKNEVFLSISDLFLENGINYTWEEYDEHFRLTQEFAAKNENYFLDECAKPDFHNIKISIYGNTTAIVSKNIAPNIHFLIQNSTLVKA